MRKPIKIQIQPSNPVPSTQTRETKKYKEKPIQEV